MALKTDEEQLEEVQTAISRALNGQSWSANGKSVTRPPLEVLYAKEAVLLRRIRAAQGIGGPCCNTGVRRYD